MTQNDPDEWEGYEPYQGFRRWCQDLLREGLTLYWQYVLGVSLGLLVGLVFWLLQLL